MKARVRPAVVRFLSTPAAGGEEPGRGVATVSQFLGLSLAVTLRPSSRTPSTCRRRLSPPW